MKRQFYKIAFACMIFLCGINSRAQAQVDSLRTTLDNIFLHVDKSQVPTGFLDEYGAQFANLKTYNGILTDSNIVNAMAWHYIYASVYSAKIYGTNTLPTPETNYTVFNSEAILNADVSPVSMLVLNYSSLKPDALTNNLFTISNNQLYDVPGRTQSPYQLNTAFAAAPFYETDEDGTLSLIFKQNLFINTTGKTVSSIQVNFANGGGFVTAAWSTAISATYMDTGIKVLTFKLNFTDGSNVQCFSNVKILKAAGTFLYQPNTITIPFNPTNNNHAGGDITVQYSVNNTTPITNRRFQKPLIVVEGFDVHDAAPLLMQRGYNYNNFRDEITDVIFQSNGNSFNYNLDNIGSYDLIFLNYRDGTDDIIRNALLLEDVINWVNNNKDVGAQQNVVIGISMGGLVSRYCLAKMTKENHPPQTRLLITHDSPHRGANIPLGMQYLINDFANQNVLGRRLQDWIPALHQTVNLQLRPATLQQLIVRNNPGNGNLEYNTFLVSNGTYRNMVTFPSGGPQPAYTFIATSQGSQCGVQVMPPYQAIVNTSADAGYTFAFGSFGTKFIGAATINALPNGTASQRITYFNLKAKIKIFYINIPVTILSFVHNSPSAILGYDGCPAGTQPLSRGTGVGNLPPTWNSGPWFIPPFIFEYVYNFGGLQLQPEFSFLPTSSALDEDNITANSLYGPHIGSFYSPPGNDPSVLQKYVAQERIVQSGVNVYNLQHTDFTARNSNWMFNEMQNISNQTVNCTGVSECGNYNLNISGDNNFCVTSTSYNIPGLPAGATVVWSVTPSGIATPNTPNLTQTTLGATGNGIVTLKADISNACGVNLAITKPNIAVGKVQPGPITFPLIDAGLGKLQAQIDPVPNAISYKWYKNGVLQTGNGAFIQMAITRNICNVYYDISVAAISSCGTSLQTHGNAYVPPCNNAFTVSPNPASNTINVAADVNGSQLSRNTGIDEIRIYDIQGTLKKDQQFSKAGSATINIQGLTNGSYFVEIISGSYREKHQLVVQN